MKRNTNNSEDIFSKYDFETLSTMLDLALMGINYDPEGHLQNDEESHASKSTEVTTSQQCETNPTDFRPQGVVDPEVEEDPWVTYVTQRKDSEWISSDPDGFGPWMDI